jgi:hypothetical protein
MKGLEIAAAVLGAQEALEKIAQAEPLIAYHYTPRKNAAKILKEGLKSPVQQGGAPYEDFIRQGKKKLRKRGVEDPSEEDVLKFYRKKFGRKTGDKVVFLSPGLVRSRHEKRLRDFAGKAQLLAIDISGLPVLEVFRKRVRRIGRKRAERMLQDGLVKRSAAKPLFAFSNYPHFAVPGPISPKRITPVSD